jgi:hypothetical protein
LDACVFGVPCAEFGQGVAAVALAAPGASGVDLPWITSRLRATLGRLKHPRALSHLPLRRRAPTPGSLIYAPVPNASAVGGDLS